MCTFIHFVSIFKCICTHIKFEKVTQVAFHGNVFSAMSFEKQIVTNLESINKQLDSFTGTLSVVFYISVT